MKIIRHLLILALSWCAIVDNAAQCNDSRTYAVIISGGRSKMFNHERYWNDCAFLYRTLRQDCNIPKSHITLLMADGDNAATDMLRDGAKGFASSPTDLDGDGQADLTLAATRHNVDNTFRQLSATMTSADRLFIFITDHGERDGDGCVHLWLWGYEQVSPGELASMVGQCRPATMTVLLGQCYAGAFMEELQGEKRIIIAACSAGQMSWSCKDRPYDEFVYHWTCAVAQHDETGQSVCSDNNGDGRVSMAEAYDYARQHDQRPETPSITAQPASLATQWSFGGIETENGISQISVLKYQRTGLYDLKGQKKRK